MKGKSNLMKSLFENDSELDEINKLTEKIIGCAYKVSNELGCGFLERVYENALAHEIRKLGVKVEQQKKIEVYYDGVEVGIYVPDLFVADTVIAEVKTVSHLENVHRAQCMNYLSATKTKICLLINFGNSKVEVKRIIL